MNEFHLKHKDEHHRSQQACVYLAFLSASNSYLENIESENDALTFE
jgi:hypothetical protein